MSKRKIVLIVILFLALGAGWWFWSHKNDEGDKAKPVAGPIPVRVVDAALRDIPVFLTGIGNVQSLNSVTIRPQIDGELIRLYFEEGQKVKKGDLLAEIDSRAIRADLASAQAEKASNAAQLAIAQMDLTRYNNLLQEDAIAHQIVDQQKAKVQQLQAAVNVAQAVIDAANVRLSFTQIRSPLSGIAGIRRVDPGNIVSAANTEGLVTITQIDSVAVVFSLPQTDLNEVLPLLQAKHTQVDILPKEDDAVIATGHLQAIDNQVDQATGTVRLKVLVPNDRLALWPGQFVVARIMVKTFRDRIAIPLSAVQRGQKNTFVYRIRDAKAEAVDVSVIFENEMFAVVEGIDAKDQIVVDGQMRLKPGSMVNIVNIKNNVTEDKNKPGRP